MTELEQKRFHLFRNIYNTNVSALVRFAARFTPDDAARDIVQDVFVSLWNSSTDLDPGSVRSYLFVAVRNRCMNFLKQEQRKNRHADSVRTENRMLEMEYFDSAEKTTLEDERLEMIRRHIDRLPEKCQEIFKLAYYEEKKSAEIASMLNLSVRTVEHQLYLGLKALRERIFNCFEK